ncbi:MAG: ADP-heptose--LPS heptosyltransferase, partial [Verrucomicrobia bacterium]
MRRGDFDAAWVISDEVLSERQGLSCDDRPRHEQWVWRGEPLRGNVLIRCNHGLGDTIQFIRYAAIVRGIVERVIVEAPPELLSLLRTAEGIDRVVPQGHEDDTFYDAAVEVMELPHVFRTDIHNIPARVPYFRIAPEPVSFTARLNVGLVWH